MKYYSWSLLFYINKTNHYDHFWGVLKLPISCCLLPILPHLLSFPRLANSFSSILFYLFPYLSYIVLSHTFLTLTFLLILHICPHQLSCLSLIYSSIAFVIRSFLPGYLIILRRHARARILIFMPLVIIPDSRSYAYTPTDLQTPIHHRSANGISFTKVNCFSFWDVYTENRNCYL